MTTNSIFWILHHGTVNSMGLLYEDRKARNFVNNMHGRRVTLDAFIRLFNIWLTLTSEERQEVFDICELEHPDMYNGVFPGEFDIGDNDENYCE